MEAGLLSALDEFLQFIFFDALNFLWLGFDALFNLLKLPVLSVLLGLGLGLPQVYALIKPKDYIAKARQFPRKIGIGWVFTLLATFWFLYYVKIESVSDFGPFKHTLMFFFLVVGIGTCIYLKDFLAVRGLAVLMLLCAKLMVDTARWADTDWRLVISVWAYIWIIAGMWFTISPWRLRDFIDWSTATEERLRLLSGIRLAFALFIIALGLTVFRWAEQHREPTRVAHRPQPFMLQRGSAASLR